MNRSMNYILICTERTHSWVYIESRWQTAQKWLPVFNIFQALYAWDALTQKSGAHFWAVCRGLCVNLCPLATHTHPPYAYSPLSAGGSSCLWKMKMTTACRRVAARDRWAGRGTELSGYRWQWWQVRAVRTWPRRVRQRTTCEMCQPLSSPPLRPSCCWSLRQCRQSGPVHV